MAGSSRGGFAGREAPRKYSKLLDGWMKVKALGKGWVRRGRGRRRREGWREISGEKERRERERSSELRDRERAVDKCVIRERRNRHKSTPEPETPFLRIYGTLRKVDPSFLPTASPALLKAPSALRRRPCDLRDPRNLSGKLERQRGGGGHTPSSGGGLLAKRETCAADFHC